MACAKGLASSRRGLRCASRPREIRPARSNTLRCLEIAGWLITTSRSSSLRCLDAAAAGCSFAEIATYLRDKGFEETVAFTQRDVFTMLSYHLLQRGPAFAMDLDVRLTRSGDYRVTTTSHKVGRRKHYSGKLDLPPDIYNGMVITIAKNLSAGITTTVHIVAFTPKPRLIGLEMTGANAPPTMVGERAERTVRFTLKPQLGPLLNFFARLFGKLPPDSHAWIVTQDVPAFVRFEGPMYFGPVWRIDLIGPAAPGNGPTMPPK